MSDRAFLKEKESKSNQFQYPELVFDTIVSKNHSDWHCGIKNLINLNSGEILTQYSTYGKQKSNNYYFCHYSHYSWFYTL